MKRRAMGSCEKLMTIRQMGSMREYSREFVILASNNQYLHKQVLETAYLVGLRPEIGVRVRLHEPRNLEKMMSLALGWRIVF